VFISYFLPSSGQAAMMAVYLIGQSSKVQNHWFRTETN